MHSENEVVYLHLDDIIPNRFQPREIFDERALKELAISIKEHGVIQPIIVREIGNKYEIIAGERRYKASALAGLTKIPAIVKNLDDKESSKVALLENLQRKNLNPVEEARTYQKILELDQMTQEELAKTMGKSQSAVANKLRLLVLPEEVQQALLKEQISERHARTLLGFESTEKQKEMLDRIIQTRMTVRELEDEIKSSDKKEEDIFAKNPSISKELITPTNNIEIPTNEIHLGNLEPKMEEPNLFSNDITIDNQENVEENVIPAEEPTEHMPKFINYGEIDPDEDDDTEGETLNFGQSPASSTIDIDVLKSNVRDINEPEKKVADLDSLLKIAPLSTETKIEDKEELEPYKFFATETKEKPLPKESKNNETNLFSSFNEPKISMTAEATVPKTPDRFEVKDAINTIRNTVKDLEDKGMKVDSDEINFENSYQIVIKISKNN